jgi:flagellar motor switch/type III secretory pathway protein FliN
VCSAVLWNSDSGRAPTIHAVQAPDRSAAGFVRLSFTVGDRAAAGLEVVLGEEQARRAVRSSARVRRKLPLAALRGIRVPVVCCLAEVRLPLREIGSLSVGDLITLDDAQLDTVLIRAGGRPAFRGDAGIQGSRIAVRITAVEGAADAPKPPQPGIALGDRALPPAPARPGESRPQGESS